MEAAAQPTTLGTPLAFTATAYCKGETTASGVGVRTGVAAADPALLPVGSVDSHRHARLALRRHLDDHGHGSRGPGPHHRSLHVELPRRAEVRAPLRCNVNVLRLGWNPQNSEPGVVDVLFRKRERDKALMPIPAKLVDPTSVLLPAALSSPPL